MSDGAWAAPPDKTFASYEEFYATSQYARFDQTHRRGGSLGLFGLEVDQGPIDFIDSPLPEYVFQTELLGTRDVCVDMGEGAFERRQARKASLFFLVPPETVARFRIDAPHKVRSISVHKSVLDPLLEEHGLGPDCFHRWYAAPTATFIDSPLSAGLVNLLDALWRAMGDPRCNSLLIDGLAMQLVACAAADFAPLAARPDDARIARAIDYIETYINLPLTVAELAAVACLSQGHFARVFRMTTGLAVWAYVQQRRCERARELLTTTSLPIAEIAYRCGFASQAHMTTCFGKHFRLTPGRFRH